MKTSPQNINRFSSGRGFRHGLAILALLCGSAAAIADTSSLPVITTQPASQTVNVGASVTFTVVATSTASLSYQWYKGDPLIAGATGSTLTLTNVQTADAGNYRVRVTNSAGTVVSKTATLTVVAVMPPVPAPPVITTQPLSQTVIAGGTASFTVVASSSTTLAYQWYKALVVTPLDGTTSVVFTPITGATDATLTITNVQTSDAGIYNVVVTNAGGSVVSNAATLTVVLPPIPAPPVITTQPVSQTANAGATVTFTVVASSSTTLSYQWCKLGASATSTSDGYKPIPGATGATLTLVNVQAADVGAYRVTVSNAGGSVVSNAATLTVVLPPVITKQPESHTVKAGATVTFTVVATSSTTLSYQWSQDGAPITGATGSSLALTNVQITDAGSYTVAVSNSAGSVISNPATLTVLAPPVITTQPASQTVKVGAAVTFTVAATGSTPLKYQWSKGSMSLPGATSASLTLASVVVSDAGNYRVVVSNEAGRAVSNPATLTVVTPLTITKQPESQIVKVGATVTFRVAATGSTPLKYQWSKGSTPIDGATGASLVLTKVKITDSGSYTVAISNAAGRVVSNPAILNVIPPDTRATQAVVSSITSDGGTVVTITNTITYTGAVTGIGWQVLLPAGWSYVSGGGSEGDIKPAPGTTDLLEWTWTTVPSSPVTFTYSLNVPPSAVATATNATASATTDAGATISVRQVLTALVSLQFGDVQVQFLPQPDPLPVP